MMGVTKSNIRAYLLWVESKIPTDGCIIDVLKSLVSSQIESTSTGFAILGTSAHGTSINYGSLKDSGGLNVNQILWIFDYLLQRCLQAKKALEAKGLPVTNEAIIELVLQTIILPHSLALKHDHPRGI